MSKELEILRGLSQAMGYAYDGATDENGERIKIGLKRDEKNPLMQSRDGDMDGFGIQMVGQKLYVKYHSEAPMKEVHRRGPDAYQGDVEERFANIAKFLKERYKKATGNALSLKADGEADILLQYMNRKRSWIQATKCYTIGGLKGVAEPERPAYDITRDFLKAAKYGS
jgi:hypothetical protein